MSHNSKHEPGETHHPSVPNTIPQALLDEFGDAAWEQVRWNRYADTVEAERNAKRRRTGSRVTNWLRR